MLGDVLGSPEPQPIRAFDDYPKAREAIFGSVLNSIQKRFPIENQQHSLLVENARYDDDKQYSLAEQKKAILQGGTLSRKLIGDWVLRDKTTGAEIDRRRRMTLAQVPYLTNRGTFISNGTEYTVANQARLRPGVYSRVKENGEYESHINLRPGSGRSFKLYMEPQTGVFRLGVGQSTLKLYPVLRAMGVSDDDISKSWGRDLLQANAAATDSRAVSRAYSQFVRTRDVEEQEAVDSEALIKTSEEKMGSALLETLGKGELDPEVTSATLGEPFDRVSPNVILRTTKKLLDIQKGTADTDDRDALAYQQFYTPEDFFAERISKDAGQNLRKILWKSTLKGNLSSVPTGAMTKQLRSVLLNSGLGSTLEEVNPYEVHNQTMRVTRMGVGGIGSMDAVPDESRAVSPSQFGIIDLLLTPESSKVGIDTRFTHGVMKGPNNTVMFPVRKLDGKTTYLTSGDASKTSIAFPGEMASDSPKVRALVNGSEIDYVPREEVQYELPHAMNMFSDTSNLIPFIGSMKGGRVSMGARMVTQSLPLRDSEAPLVQTEGEGGKSFHESYGRVAGVVRSDADGVVTDVSRDGITVKHSDGTVKRHDVYDNFPLNRRTYYHNTPAVQVGDKVSAGSLLAYSNYTDKKGVVATGKNLRVGYLPWNGKNYEDAIAISEGAAEKLTSEHLYQHVLPTTDQTEIGRKSYIAQYPAKFKSHQLQAIGDNGVIKPGAVVKYGDPLILALEKTKYDAVHRGRSQMYKDNASTWKHYAPGEVTDVEQTSDGSWNVTVKSYARAEVGDKLSNRFGGKGIIADIIPDAKMPQDKDGTPLDILLNPLGIVSRGNPSQLFEAALGKVARKTGKPVLIPHFMPGKALEFTKALLAKNGLSDTEDLVDPNSGRTIPKVFTGEAYIMKLHHTAEGKGKGRDIGGYTMDELPAKGSDDGCFPANQKVQTIYGEVKIGHLVEKQRSTPVFTYSDALGEWVYRPVTDWFTRRARVSDLLTIYLESAPLASTPSKKTTRCCRAQDRCLYPTKNHNVYLFDGRVVRADQLKVGDELVSYGCLPTEDQMSVLLGTLLGDAYILHGFSGYPGVVGYEHSQKQLKYAKWKNNLLSTLQPTYKLRTRDASTSSVCSGEINSIICNINNPYLAKKLFDVCYSGDKFKKRVTQAWLDRVGDVGIALFLLDDGSLRRQSTRRGKYRWSGAVATMGYSYEENVLLARWLTYRLGASCNVVKSGHQYRLSLSTVAVQRAMELVAKHVPESVIPGSKLSLKRLVGGIQINNPAIPVSKSTKLEKIPVRIRAISPYKHDKPNIDEINVYDITVCDTHSYLVGGIRVSNSKRIANMELASLISHGATKVIKDAKLVRGQRNDEWWKMFRVGLNPPSPKIPLVYEKFLASLQGAGINLTKKPNSIHLFAMTQKDAESLAGEELTVADTVKAQDLEPIEGGLFDKKLTGGHGGDKWSALKLSEPMPNPVMEDPLRKILGVTQKKFEGIIAGTDDLHGYSGGEGMLKYLSKLDLDREINAQTQIIKSGARSKRDAAVKTLGFLKSMKSAGLQPKDFMMTTVPVLPPKFRPIAKTDAMTIISDPNYLYKDLMNASADLKELSSAAGFSGSSEERLRMYNAFKAVTGLGDPVNVKTQERGVRGLLKHVFGANPKSGLFNRRVIGIPTDVVGRGVVAPDADLSMDEIGVPENKAWVVYRSFVIRRLVRGGMPATEAVRAVAEQRPEAKRALEEELLVRPVLLNRAPTLHRYNFMAFKPKLIKDKTIHVSPVITKGFGMDFDGDSCVGSTICHLTTPKDFGSISFDRGGGRLGQTKGDAEMFKCSESVKTVGCETELHTCKLVDFPRIESTMKVSEKGVVSYQVPDGVCVWSYDNVTGTAGFFPVTEFSIHPNCKGYTVNTVKGAQVGVSDDHSLYLFDADKCELVRGQAATAVGKAVPVIVRSERRSVCNQIPMPTDLLKNRQWGENQNKPVLPVEQIIADFDFGWWLGATISDGWSDAPLRGIVNYAKQSDELRAKYIQECNRLVPGVRCSDPIREQHVDEGMRLNAESVRISLYSTALSNLVAKWVGKGAANKHIPSFFVSLPDECLWGVFSGLLDGDGSISINNSAKRKTPGFNCQYTTVSPQLKDDIIFLGKLLGIRVGVTPYRGNAFALSFSLPDIYKNRHKIKLTEPDKRRKFESIFAPARDHGDMVPLPKALAPFISAELAKAGMSVAAVSTAKGGNLISRGVAREWYALLEKSGCKHPQVELWSKLLNDTSITWDRVSSIESLPEQVMYDITVPDTLVFAVNGGLIVYDTANWHVPASDEAVKESLEKMLPSKNLLYARNFKAHYLPSQEMMYGLYLATRKAQKKQPRVFASKEAAMQAYQSGELRHDDPIIIGKQ